MPLKTQRLLLQILIALGGCVPVFGGALGMFAGQHMLGTHAHAAGDIALDSHIRYLSGLLFGMGIAFWNMIPWIERATKYVRLLTLVIFIGGLARLYAALFIAWPPVPMQLALGMELVVTPAICVWQGHIARLYADQSV